MIRLSILSGIFMLISGCGGSGGSTGGNGGNNGGGNNPTTVTITIPGSPTAVATQVGSGTFTAATLSNGSLTLSLPSGTTNFGVAYVCPPVTVTSYQETNQNIIEANTLDVTSFSLSCSAASSTGATGALTVSYNALGISGANSVGIFAQNSTASSYSTLGPSYVSGSFNFAEPTGTDRVEVLAYNSTLNGNSLVAAKDFDGVTVPGVLNGGNTVVFGTADETTSEPITYNSVPSGFNAPTTTVAYYMGNSGIWDANVATTAYPALPATAMESGDYYYFSAGASGPSGEVIVDTTSTSGGPMSFTFPPAWTYAGPAAAKWPSFNINYTGFSGTTGVCDDVSMNWITNSTVWNVVSLTATGNYLNGSTTLAIPDLSGLPGFVAAPASGTSAAWEASVSQGTSTCIPPHPLNSTTKMVTTGGVYTAP
jgi:hypothetical protein